MPLVELGKEYADTFSEPGVKPREAVENVDPSAFSWLFRNDLVDLRNENPFNNFGTSLSQDGVDFGAGGNYLLSENNGPSGTGDITVIFEMQTTQAGIANHHMINIGAATNDNMFVVIRYGNSLKFGAWGQDNFSSTVTNDGEPHLCMMVYDGSDIKMYIDGELDTTSGAYSALNISALPIHLGSFRGLPTSTTFSYTGSLNHFHILDRALSAAEVKSIAKSWAASLLKPVSPPSVFFVPDTGGISPAIGDITLSGQDVTVTETTNISVNSTSIPISGKDVSVVSGTNITPGKATITLQGQTVDIVQETNIQPASADIVLTGQDVSITSGAVLQPAKGALSLAGQSVTVTATRLISVAKGMIQLVGKRVPRLTKSALGTSARKMIERLVEKF